MRESGSASRALSGPVLNDSRSAKSTDMTAKDRLLHFIGQPPKVEKNGEFGVTAQFVIEVQPLSIRNSFQQLFLPACARIKPKSLLFKPKWIWRKIPDVIRDRIVQLSLDEVCANAEMGASGADKTGSNANVESSARRSMRGREISPVMFGGALFLVQPGTWACKPMSQIDRLGHILTQTRSFALCEDGRLIECPVCGRSHRFGSGPMIPVNPDEHTLSVSFGTSVGTKTRNQPQRLSR
jgi:hypothetical protein